MNPEFRLYWLLRRRLAEPPSLAPCSSQSLPLAGTGGQALAANRGRRRINAVLRYWLGGIIIG